ncbi:hypothetical protein VP01_9584g1, partial [Puccinia sorghi]
PNATLTKQQEIVHLEESWKNHTTLSAKPSEKYNEDQSDSAAALMHESKKEKKKARRGPFCAPGKHNPEATSHDANHCWQPHPKLRPSNSGKLLLDLKLQLPNWLSKPIVLDSGATHHLVNNPEVFRPMAKSNIKIATGGHSNFLNATAVGSAVL